MIYIYILKLENNKYYVGKTSHPKTRIDQHFANQGSSWTKKHNPIDIEAIIPDCDDYDEDKYVKKYMDKFGIDNVRGGTFSQIKLKEEDSDFIEKSSISSNDKCLKCGKKGHFAKRCKVKKSIDMKCDRCGRNNHNKENCYAKTTIDGLVIL